LLRLAWLMKPLGRRGVLVEEEGLQHQADLAGQDRAFALDRDLALGGLDLADVGLGPSVDGR
jgi:hypothetical protein